MDNNKRRRKLTPKPYQKAIISREIKRLNHCLFMDMGTGKTLVTLEILGHHLNNDKVNKAVIVCPKSKLDDWYEDIKAQLEIKSVHVHKGNAKTLQESVDIYQIVICTYDLIWRSGELDLKGRYALILDESHRIKSWDSKRSRFLALGIPIGRSGRAVKTLDRAVTFQPPLCSQAISTFILTGTPQSLGYVDYYPQLKFIKHWSMTQRQFQNSYCVYKTIPIYTGGRVHQIQQLSGYRNVDELNESINNVAVYHYRDNSDCLPNEIYHKCSIPEKVYNKAKKDKVIEDVVIDNAPALRHCLRQLTSGDYREFSYPSGKKEFVKDLLTDTPKRVVIFYNYDIELELLTKLVGNRPIAQFNAHKDRGKELITWNDKEDCVALVQYQSGSEGVNDFVLSQCAVFFSPPVSIILFQQAKKRLDRIGQIAPPLMYFLTTKGIDSYIYQALQAGLDFDDNMYQEYLNGQD